MFIDEPTFEMTGIPRVLLHSCVFVLMLFMIKFFFEEPTLHVNFICTLDMLERLSFQSVLIT